MKIKTGEWIVFLSVSAYVIGATGVLSKLLDEPVSGWTRVLVYIGWIGLAIVAGLIGRSRQIGSTNAILYSILLTPAFGLVRTLVSKPLWKSENRENREKALGIQPINPSRLAKIAMKTTYVDTAQIAIIVLDDNVPLLEKIREKAHLNEARKLADTFIKCIHEPEKGYSKELSLATWELSELALCIIAKKSENTGLARYAILELVDEIQLLKEIGEEANLKEARDLAGVLVQCKEGAASLKEFSWEWSMLAIKTKDTGTALNAVFKLETNIPLLEEIKEKACLKINRDLADMLLKYNESTKELSLNSGEWVESELCTIAIHTKRADLAKKAIMELTDHSDCLEEIRRETNLKESRNLADRFIRCREGECSKEYSWELSIIAIKTKEVDTALNAVFKLEDNMPRLKEIKEKAHFKEVRDLAGRLTESKESGFSEEFSRELSIIAIKTKAVGVALNAVLKLEDNIPLLEEIKEKADLKDIRDLVDTFIKCIHEPAKGYSKNLSLKTWALSESELSLIAKKTKHFGLARYAVFELVDAIHLLKEIRKEARLKETRELADTFMQCIKGASSTALSWELSLLAIKTKEVGLALNAVFKLEENTPLLKEIKEKADLKEVRDLVDMFMKCIHESVNRGSLKYLSNSWELSEAALCSIAKKTRHVGLARYAIFELVDYSNSLKEIRKEARLDEARELAGRFIQCLSGTSAKEFAWELSLLAIKTKYFHVARNAINELEDDLPLLEEIRKKACLKEARQAVGIIMKYKNESSREFAGVLNTEDRFQRLQAIRENEKNEELLGLVAGKDKDYHVRIHAVEKISDPDKLMYIALKDSNCFVRLTAFRRLTNIGYLMMAEIAAKDKCKIVNSEPSDRINRMILLYHFPSDKETGSVIEYLSSRHAGAPEQVEEDHSEILCTAKEREEEITVEGWATAALGRCITNKLTPATFKEALAEYDRILDRYRETVETYNLLVTKILKDQETIKAVQKQGDAHFRKIAAYLHEKDQGEAMDGKSAKETEKEVKEQTEIVIRLRNNLGKADALKPEVEAGPLKMLFESGCIPVGYLIRILNDSQGQFPVFVKQGAIMGIQDFLTAHKNAPDVKPYYQRMTELRESMVDAAQKQGFFEVRAPEGCDDEEYAALLELVLREARPGIDCCDTCKLMRLAGEEIPDVMDMLVKYPLRLTDTKDAKEGSQLFKPYEHNMWFSFSPPVNLGVVNRRYHMVEDRTLPLSAGLNLKLFTDPYQALPVIFHENEHFRGDYNEASVWLKTHVFSRGFYARHPEANAAKDTSFALMKKTLGESLKPSGAHLLNFLIEQRYGKQLSETEAKRKAERELEHINSDINKCNKNETWCPEALYPPLNDSGDAESASMIREIIIRYSMLPRTLTNEMFRKIIHQENLE